MDTWPQMTLAGGPVQMTDRTLRDQSRPMLYHYDPAFIEFFSHTTELLQKVFRTRYDVVILQAEAILGLEGAAACLISPGDKVLNLVSGVFGKWFELFIEKHGGETIELAVPYNDSIDPEDVRRKLEAEPSIKFLSVVHSETPSATINPMREIGAIAREHGVLTIVDTVSGARRRTDEPRGLGNGRCHRRPPKMPRRPSGTFAPVREPRGLGGDGEQKHAASRKLPSRSSTGRRRGSRTTASPIRPPLARSTGSSRYSPKALEEGVEDVARRHQTIAKACRRGVEAMGLELWAAREAIASPAVTGVVMPKGIDDEELRGHLRSRYRGHDLWRLWRLGRQALSPGPHGDGSPSDVSGRPARHARAHSRRPWTPVRARRGSRSRARSAIGLGQGFMNLSPDWRGKTW